MLTADHFIKKLEPIPSSKWACGTFYHSGMRCALGHCGRTASKGMTEESAALADLLTEHYGPTLADRLKTHPDAGEYLKAGPEGVVGAINDGLHRDFPQKTPKARILAALTALT